MEKITIDANSIIAEVQQPTSVTELEGGLTRFEFVADTKESAMKLGKKLTRNLIKFGLHKNLTGNLDKNVLVLTFGVEGGELPLTWRPKSAKPTRAGLLVELKAGLDAANIDSTYFNSSKNVGIVIDDTRVPFGMQFALDETGLVARILKSASIARGKVWTDRQVATVVDALELIDLAMGL